MSKVILIFSCFLGLVPLAASAADEYSCDFSKRQEAPRNASWPEGAIEKRLWATGRTNTRVLSLAFVSRDAATGSIVKATICNGDGEQVTIEKFTLHKQLNSTSSSTKMVYKASALDVEADTPSVARAP